VIYKTVFVLNRCGTFYAVVISKGRDDTGRTILRMSPWEKISQKGGAVMIYHNLMELIQRKEAAIIEELVYEIRGQEETRHYGNLSDEMLNERLHHVLYNVYKRLSNWLHNNTSKNVVFAYYTGLGRERYKEGIPLEEVIQVLFIIKKKIYHHITDRKAVDNGYTLHQITELFYYVNSFFDKIAYAIIVGYQEGIAIRACA